jgi:hypothetical protein
MAGSADNLSLVANLNMMGTNEDDEHGTGSRFGLLFNSENGAVWLNLSVGKRGRLMPEVFHFLNRSVVFMHKIKTKKL